MVIPFALVLPKVKSLYHALILNSDFSEENAYMRERSPCPKKGPLFKAKLSAISPLSQMLAPWPQANIFISTSHFPCQYIKIITSNPSNCHNYFSAICLASIYSLLLKCGWTLELSYSPSIFSFRDLSSTLFNWLVKYYFIDDFWPHTLSLTHSLFRWEKWSRILLYLHPQDGTRSVFLSK